MKVIVGLGNYGRKFARNRHNLGFLVVDRLQSTVYSQDFWLEREKLLSVVCRPKAVDIMLAKPTTFMNNSGTAVKKLINFYHIQPNQVWIIHDDLDFDFGRLKIQIGDGAAGHKGIESVIANLQTANFVRFRVGIGKGESQDAEEYVLEDFNSAEKKALPGVINRVVEAVEFALENSPEQAMNKFN